jgi:hypothetical protein
MHRGGSAAARVLVYEYLLPRHYTPLMHQQTSILIEKKKYY